MSFLVPSSCFSGDFDTLADKFLSGKNEILDLLGDFETKVYGTTPEFLEKRQGLFPGPLGLGLAIALSGF